MYCKQNIFRITDRGRYIHISKLKGNRYQFVFKSASGQHYYIETDREFDIENEAVLSELEQLQGEVFSIRNVIYDEIHQKFQISGIYKNNDQYYRFSFHNSILSKEEPVEIFELTDVVDGLNVKKYSYPLGETNGNIMLAICEDEEGYESILLYDLKDKKVIIEHTFSSDKYRFNLTDFCVNSDMKVIVVGSYIEDGTSTEISFISEFDPLLKQLF